MAPGIRYTPLGLEGFSAELLSPEELDCRFHFLHTVRERKIKIGLSVHVDVI